MLKFYKKSNVKNIQISVDKYVPLTVNFSDNITSELYWRVGDGISSLLEIGLLNSGELNSITLVCFENSDINLVTKKINEIENFESVFPIFDTSLWVSEILEYRDTFLDSFSENFTIQLLNNILFISFLKKGTSVKLIGSDEIVFGVNESEELSLIVIKNLSNEMIETLHNYYSL
ncbi:hypothetical protein [Acinetobacter seifertii]|uniref:hypothetical protein n=1 Tax=Acinetobacter seifertii TaxID=1530123 RepID=UPI000D3CDA3C|nr:hypothetical protein [Acinetobacter seifertii]PTV49598.1 hypothetical protein DBL04_18000 [Acinetobacter seifertii]